MENSSLSERKNIKPSRGAHTNLGRDQEMKLRKTSTEIVKVVSITLCGSNGCFERIREYGSKIILVGPIRGSPMCVLLAEAHDLQALVRGRYVTLPTVRAQQSKAK